MKTERLNGLSTLELLKLHKAIRNLLKEHKLTKGIKHQPVPDAKTNGFDEIRKTHQNAYLPWNDAEDIQLEFLFYQRMKIKDIALEFGRTRGAISSRIKKLELRE